MAGGSRISSIARYLDGFAAACYRLRRSFAARLAFLILMLIALGLTLFSRPGAAENSSVGAAQISDVSISTINTYLRLSGYLDPSRVYQTTYPLGGIQLRGSRYIPLVSPQSLAEVYVLDEGLPAYEPGREVTLVGQIVAGTGAQPPLYLQIGYPPNVVLANTLARAGTYLLVLLVAALLIAWLVHRADYAIPVPWSSSAGVVAGAPALSWSGDLGRQYNDVIVRNQPATFMATPHEARIESAEPKGLWSVAVRRLKSVQLFDVASRYGSLPAARIWFDDERGLSRRGVVATNSAASRDALLQVLSVIR